MKSPEQLAGVLLRQWHSPDKREQRLLDPQSWPLRLAIGRPSPDVFAHRTAQVREHIGRWRAVSVGTVQWQDSRYRSAAAPVSLPHHWELASPQEWAAAIADVQVQLQLQQLTQLLDQTDPQFHSLLIRQRALWRDRDHAEVAKACVLAMQLQPGMAGGRPLRSIAMAGIDSKFMERNRALVTALLDLRFDKLASRQGLTSFLGAADEGEHWLLVVPLAAGLLPFAQQRLRARELTGMPLPAARILLIENERCLHLLPVLEDTIAVLGSGLNLAWLGASWLQQRELGYWGDMDSWGLCMLARSRCLQPHVQALLMQRSVFDQHAAVLAVPESVSAGTDTPTGLTDQEGAFYQYLLQLPKGRIEQEFLPRPEVASALRRWVSSSVAL